MDTKGTQTDLENTAERNAPAEQADGDVTTTRDEADDGYSDELRDEILASVAGGKSLKRTLEQKGMPTRVTWYRWLRTHEGLLALYEAALTDKADALADDIEDIAEKTLKGEYDHRAAAVAMDGKKWAAAVNRPKKYGSKVDVTSGGERIGDVSSEQAAQLVAARAERSDPE